MSRLTEALARARETADDGSVNENDVAVTSAAPAAAEVPATWHFEDAPLHVLESHADTPGAPPAPVVRPEESSSARVLTVGREPAPILMLDDGLDAKVVAGKHVDPAFVEQYRRLGAVLHNHQQQHGSRSVMIGSAVAAEGKTLTATNLALTLAQSYQRRVLLIDADLRRPTIHSMFRLPNNSGLIEILTDGDNARRTLHRVLPTLWVLTGGRPTTDPMGALVSESMKRLIAEASQQFDWVVVDTPPVVLMPDANLLAAMIDTALVVIGASSTPYPLVLRAISAIGPTRVLGAILNRVEQQEIADEYGYYYGYHYRNRTAHAESRGRRGIWPFATKA